MNRQVTLAFGYLVIVFCLILVAECLKVLVLILRRFVFGSLLSCIKGLNTNGYLYAEVCDLVCRVSAIV